MCFSLWIFGNVSRVTDPPPPTQPRCQSKTGINLSTSSASTTSTTTTTTTSTKTTFLPSTAATATPGFRLNFFLPLALFHIPAKMWWCSLLRASLKMPSHCKCALKARALSATALQFMTRSQPELLTLKNLNILSAWKAQVLLRKGPQLPFFGSLQSCLLATVKVSILQVRGKEIH